MLCLLCCPVVKFAKDTRKVSETRQNIVPNLLPAQISDVVPKTGLLEVP